MKYANFINKADEANKVLQFKLQGEITASGTITPEATNGFLLSEAIGYWANQGYKIELHINSYGGNIISSMSVLNQVEKNKVDTHILGVAFSSAGLIAVAGNKRTMNDYSKIMVHSANIAGEEGKTESEKAGISAFNDSIASIFNNRTNIPNIDEMLKKDTFIDSDEAVKLSMVDSVIQTGRKNKVDTQGGMLNIYDNVCKLINNDKNKIQMDFENKYNELRDKNSVTEAKLKDVDNKYLELAKDKEALEAENKALLDENKALNDGITKALHSEAKEFLNSKGISFEGKALDKFMDLYAEDKESAKTFMSIANVTPETDLTAFTNASSRSKDGNLTISNEKLDYYLNNSRGQEELESMGESEATEAQYNNIHKLIQTALKNGDIR